MAAWRTCWTTGLMVVTLVAGPAAASGAADAIRGEPRRPSATAVLASVIDGTNDVKLRRSSGGLTPKERKSIDVLRLDVRAKAESVRFSVELKALALPAPRRFEQMIFIDLAPPAGVDSEWGGNIGFSPQRPALSYAYFNYGASGTAFESCDPIRAVVSPRESRVRLDVPRKCLPAAPAQLRLHSMTGFFRSDAGGPWSTDILRIASVDFRS